MKLHHYPRTLALWASVLTLMTLELTHVVRFL